MVDTMADVNVNAPAEQAPAMAPPTRTDDQILPRSRWVPVGKSNCYLDVERSQSNPIYKISVDILKHTNFFRAFIASSTIPSIYIQQFWDTVRYDKTTGSYSCQLDEQWFDLTKDTLRDALQITPVDNNNAFSSPPTPDVLIKFVNDLGYPKVVRTLSDVVTNDMFQPWRALTTIINLCLTGKTSGFERPRAPVLQILWGVVNRAHIDYAEKMWEEFTQSIHTFIKDKKNLAQHTQGKNKATLIVIPSVRFTKLIIHHLQSTHKFHLRPGYPLHLPNEESVLGYLKFSVKGTKREVFGMPIPNNLITADIQGEQYYNAYLDKVAKHQRYLAGEEVSDPDSPAPKPAKATKPKATKQSKPSAPKAAPESSEAPSPAKRSKAGKVAKKRKPKSPLQLIDEFVDKGVLENEPRLDDEEVDLQKAVEESLKDVHVAHHGPLPPVVIREPESGKFQPLPEVQGKGKEKVGHDESSSLYAELGLTNSETESDEEVLGIDVGDQDEGQAGPNPGIQDEVQVRSNPGDVAVSQPQPSHVVHAGPNLEHMDDNLKLPTEDQVRLEEPANSAGTLSSLQNLDKEFSFTNQFLEEKSQEDEPEKTNTESEVQSMVTVPIHQDTSSVHLMTTPVIDLTVSQPVSTTVQEPLPTSTTTRIGELEQHMSDLLQDNLALEERLDKHGSKLYKYENLDIPHQVSKAVDEIVMDAVDWAIQAPLRDRFRDLPEADIKEILHHRMWETKSYEAHEDHKKLYEALKKSKDRDHSEPLLTNLAKARRKKKRRHESPKTPPGSLPHQPPPPPPPAGPSRNSGASRKRSHSSDDKDIGNDHIPKVNLKHDWWKPLSEEDRPATPEPAWSIPSSDLPVPTHNWASALASTYAPPPENSLLAQTGDMATFMDWYYLEYLRYGSKGSRPALSISKMKASYYHDVGLKQMVPDQMWIEKECKHTSEKVNAELFVTHMRILSFVQIKFFSLYGYDYIKNIVLRRADLQEYIIAERDFKYLYPSDFEDLYLLNLQGHLNHLPPTDKKILTTAVNLWTRNLVIRQRVEDLQLGIESYQTQLNLTKP
ncbi:hypothetical protein Tco_0397288 [Tanacetum coccineum]